MNEFSNKLVNQLKRSIRIQLILAFTFCILVSALIGFASSYLFVDKEKKRDFTDGMVAIDEDARGMVKKFNLMEEDINGLIIQLGNDDPAFKAEFLNRVIPQPKEAGAQLSIPDVGNDVYHLTKNELIQYIINNPKNTLSVMVTDLDGNVLYKSASIKETRVNIQHVIENVNMNFIGGFHDEHPSFTRFYPITLNKAKDYLIVSGVPNSTIVYVKEPGVTPYVLGIITFILCFYFITKRKMNEIEQIALGLMEIAKGNLKYRIKEKSQDELGTLSTNINYMASELEQMIKRQRESEKLKDELITNVSHDLRTPLTSIMGYLRLVKDHQYKNQTQLDEFVEIAYGKSEQLKKLIADLFDFTRLHDQGIKLNLQKVSLNQMLRQLMEELEPLAKESKVEFIKELPHEQIMIDIDPNQMVRALENVLTNAIKYSALPGLIHVKMTKGNHFVQITVSNPSETLSKNEVKRLFDRFYRVDTSRSSSKAGAGLGLAITKSIVELHNGSVDIEYKNQTIHLTISLPLNR